MGIVKEFKEFAMRGNVVDMAVGIIIGAEFGKIVNSLVNDIIMPPIGYLIGGLPFKDLVFNLAVPAVVAPDGTQIREASNVAIAWGSFVQTSLNFLIVAFAIFMVIKLMNTVKQRFEREKEDGAEGAPEEPSVDTKLLMEIRDALVYNNNGGDGGGLSPQRR